MRRIVAFIKRQATLVPVIAVSAIIGGATTTAVLAVIPDGGGIIHSCRSTLTGTLRVIDSEAGETCRASEVALNWSQTGPQGPQGEPGDPNADEVAFASIKGCSPDPDFPGQFYCLDEPLSRNIEAFKQIEEFNTAYCLKVSFTPVMATALEVQTGGGSSLKFGRTPTLQAQIDDLCGPGYNVYSSGDSTSNPLIFFRR
jgi:hypothetical protein